MTIRLIRATAQGMTYVGRRLLGTFDSIEAAGVAAQKMSGTERFRAEPAHDRGYISHVYQVGDQVWIVEADVEPYH